MTDHRPPEDPDPEPVPADLLASAKAAFGAHQLPDGTERPDGCLALSVFDSLLDGSAGPDDHWLRFEHATTGIDVNVAHGPNSTTIQGVVSPASAVRAVLHFEGVSLAMLAEVVDGKFSFNPVGHGLVRLSVEESNSTPTVWTEWFQI